jgi:hypothetical protein
MPPTQNNLSEADWIQIAYPSEPDWAAVPDHVRIELIERHSGEQSCASIAIGLLAQRGHARAAELARWLLNEPEADIWLQASANEALLRSQDAS